MGDAELILGAISSLHEKIDDNSGKTHERIDGLVASVGEVQVTVGEMKVSLDTVKEDVNGHLDDHKQERADANKERRRVGWTILEKMIAAVLTFCVLFLAYKLGWR